MYAITPEMLTKSVAITILAPNPTPSTVPNSQIDAPSHSLRRINHCGSPIIKPIRKKVDVMTISGSGSTFPRNLSDTSRMITTIARILAGIENIHKIEIGIMRRKAAH